MKHHTTILLAGGALIALTVRADTLTDPTRPAAFNTGPVATGAEEPVLRVEAIMRSGARHLAIVNGKLVRPGDRVDSALIRDIDTDSLRYEVGGHERVARLPSTAMKVRRERTEAAP